MREQARSPSVPPTTGATLDSTVEIATPVGGVAPHRVASREALLATGRRQSVAPPMKISTGN